MITWNRRMSLMTVAMLGMAVTTAVSQAQEPNQVLKGKRVAILVTDGFEQSEMSEPRKALDAAGARTVLVSLQKGEVQGWKDKNWGDKFPVDLVLDEAKPDEFDALLLPGGVINPDKLRMDPKAVQFVKAFVTAGKPVAAICHGPWTLVEADVVRGKKITSWPSIKTDIKNAGGLWEDAEVIADQGIISSRKPEDIPAFNRKMIEEFAKGKITGNR
jgi:protease I